MRPFAVIALAMFLALGSLPVVAQEAAEPASTVGPPAAPPATAASFLIEKIVVEGVKLGPAKIVAAETLLTLAGSYTEPQLQEALHRVERLPFVVRAEFSLRRGSERGRFELVITITGTRPVFCGGSASILRNKVAGTGGWTDADWAYFGEPEIGARVFLGDHGELRANLSGLASSTDAHDAALDVAYTHHNLFGRHLVGGASVGYLRSGLGDFTSTTITVGAQLAFPLSRADALRFAISRLDIEHESGNDPSRFSSGTTSASLSWQHDTTDDPFTPRRGTRTGVEVEYAATDTSFPGRGDRRLGHLSGSLSGSRYWALPRGLSFGVGGKLSGSEVVSGSASFGSGGETGWSAELAVDARLLGAIPVGRRGGAQYWWEIHASFSRLRTHTGYDDLPDFVHFDSRTTKGALSASISGRGRWGTVTLAFRYVHGTHESY